VLPDEPLHQCGKRQQVCDPQDRATIAKGDLRIGPHHIRPMRRHRAHGLVVDPEQEPGAVPIVPLADADELLSRERVEWVRHPYKMRCRGRRACIMS